MASSNSINLLWIDLNSVILVQLYKNTEKASFTSPKALTTCIITPSVKAAVNNPGAIIKKGTITAIAQPESVSAKDFVKPGSKALRLCYDRAFSADEFSKVTVDFMTDNNPLEVVKAVEKEIDAFNKLYQAVVPGDCYALVFVKGQGLSFFKNDVELGKPGKDKFAEAVFRIWFGPEPFSKGMRDDLLEGAL